MHDPTVTGNMRVNKDVFSNRTADLGECDENVRFLRSE